MVNIIDSYAYEASSASFSFLPFFLQIFNIGLVLLLIVALVMVIRACHLYIKKNR
jgi:hypothetical protein